MGWTKREVSTFDEAIDLEKGDSYEGKYLEQTDPIETSSGTNHLHRFEDEDGPTRSLWGAVRLTRGLKGAEGAQVRIVYNGKIKLDSGRAVKDYEVYVDEDTLPAAKPAAKPAKAPKVEADDEEPF